jgi:hypothetical protein
VPKDVSSAGVTGRLLPIGGVKQNLARGSKNGSGWAGKMTLQGAG